MSSLPSVPTTNSYLLPVLPSRLILVKSHKESLCCEGSTARTSQGRHMATESLTLGVLVVFFFGGGLYGILPVTMPAEWTHHTCMTDL